MLSRKTHTECGSDLHFKIYLNTIMLLLKLIFLICMLGLGPGKTSTTPRITPSPGSTTTLSTATRPESTTTQSTATSTGSTTTLSTTQRPESTKTPSTATSTGSTTTLSTATSTESTRLSSPSSREPSTLSTTSGKVNKEFILSSTTATWGDARQHCEQKGGKLLMYSSCTASTINSTVLQLNDKESLWFMNYESLSNWIGIKGCFYGPDFKSDVKKRAKFENNSPSLCQQFCKTALFGLQNNTCLCLKEETALNNKIKRNISLCEIRCNGHRKLPCGGNNEINVYSDESQSLDYQLTYCLSDPRDCLAECIQLECNGNEREYYLRNCSKTLSMKCGNIGNYTFKPSDWFDNFNKCISHGYGYPTIYGSLSKTNGCGKQKTEWSSIFRSFAAISTRLIDFNENNTKKCLSWTLNNNGTFTSVPSPCNQKKKFICETDSAYRDTCNKELEPVPTDPSNIDDNTSVVVGSVVALLFVLLAGGILIVFIVKKRKLKFPALTGKLLTHHNRNYQSENDMPLSGINSGKNSSTSGEKDMAHDYVYIDTNPELKKMGNSNFAYELAKPIEDKSETIKTETKGEDEANGQYFILEKLSDGETAKDDGNPYTATSDTDYDHLHSKNERRNAEQEQHNTYAHAQPIQTEDSGYDTTSFQRSKESAESDNYDHTRFPESVNTSADDPYSHLSS